MENEDKYESGKRRFFYQSLLILCIKWPPLNILNIVITQPRHWDLHCCFIKEFDAGFYWQWAPEGNQEVTGKRGPTLLLVSFSSFSEHLASKGSLTWEEKTFPLWSLSNVRTRLDLLFPPWRARNIVLGIQKPSCPEFYVWASLF